jgi:phosphomevalonate kinase
VTSTSAPGKLFLSGEYAVLEGAPALVTAVDRRAHAWTSASRPPPSPVLDAVARAVGRFLEERGSSAGSLPPVRADSSAFSRERRKLGLGSSAAVAAAACGALFEWADLDIDAHRDDILAIARRAHAQAQAGAGSGADVAAAVLGGTIIYSIEGVSESIALAGIEPVFVWTGKSASTTELIAAVRALGSADPAAYRASMDALIELASASTEAFRSGASDAIVDLTRRYGEAMAALGRAARADIVVEQHELISRLARDCGGAAKPSGAGGGDVAVAVFADGSGAKRFRDTCHSSRLHLLEVETGQPGLAAQD